jgi:hypothetical protein
MPVAQAVPLIRGAAAVVPLASSRNPAAAYATRRRSSPVQERAETLGGAQRAMVVVYSVSTFSMKMP